MAAKERTFCTVDACRNPVLAKGMCQTHYDRLRRTGSTEKQVKERTPCVRCGKRDGEYIRPDGRVCKACRQKEKRAEAVAADPGSCAYCGVEIPSRRATPGQAMYCTREHKELAWREDGRGAEASLRWYYRQRYGLTLEEAEAMRGLGCEICGVVSTDAEGRWGNLHIDHNHETGEVRGVLCTTCNTGLGQFKDSPELLEKAAAYLRRE